MSCKAKDFYAQRMAGGSIGILDSGVGGLTVARAILDQVPGEQILYIGDTANGPYGPLPLAEVRRHALARLDELVRCDVSMLVIACNSASAATLADARERYIVPVVEVVHPAVRRAVRTTRNGVVGVIGTVATIGSGAYEDAFAAAPELELVTAACPEFVSYVERGITSGPALTAVALEYLAPLVARGIDTLVLGCTHYPLLTGLIQHVVGDDVALVSSAEETAKDVYSTLTRLGLLSEPGGPAPVHRFTATGDPDSFARLARRFLGPEVVTVERVNGNDTAAAPSAGVSWS